MAAATAMELHDRRLSISRTSSSKISKPSSALKKSPSASSSSPPSSTPSRPVAKVVNADPSSFRRVVQELTGTIPSSTATSPSSSSSSPAHGSNPAVARPSRLQRIAPPPLRSDFRNVQPQYAQQDHQHQQDHQRLLQQHQQHQPSLLQQQQQASHFYLVQQQQQQQRQHMPNDLLQQQQQEMQYQVPMGGPFSPPLPLAQYGNPNSNFIPSLPMLSPHLLSPLPALTPGDNTWANPLDSILIPSPKPPSNPTNSMPPLLRVPSMSGETLANGHDQPLGRPPVGIPSSHGHPLSPLQVAPPPPLPNWLPPWSPSPFLSPPPFSPGLFPPSPGLGPFHNNTGPNNLSAMNLGSPTGFTFQGHHSDYIFKPS